MLIGNPGDAVSHICQAYPDRVEVRGRDLCDRGLVHRLVAECSCRDHRESGCERVLRALV